MRMSPRTTLLALSATLAVAACSSTAPKPSTATPAAATMGKSSIVQAATVNLASASGSLVSGKLRIVPTSDGLRLTGQIGGLGAGSTHAIHIHEKGDCSAADASSAGGHFNPATSAHGRSGTPVHHGGDMDNIVANAQGVAQVDAVARGVVLGGSVANDALGKAVVVHASPDDYSSQPAGNAGARVACGVITAAR